MRAKSEIMNTLSSKLTDDIWKKLKNSLLGRELLALGAEIISENENVKDTMLLQLNPETADIFGLYMLSQMNEVPVTSLKPSCIVVDMLEGSKTFAPFELSYSVGNVHFTNIEYTMQGKTVSLYNGTHKCYAKGSVSPSSDAVADGEETYFYDGVTSYYGIKLGNAYPDSIIMYDENGLEIPRYSSDNALSNTINILYKVVTGLDGTQYIRFVCADGYTAPSSFKIDWLDHSAMEFDVEDTEVKVDNATVATVKYTSQGRTDDNDYMRLQLKKEMAKYNGFNTPKSIEYYVKGLPYVLDAKCDKNTNGINVYIKPSSYLDLQTYLDFSEIAAHISLNSILFPNIRVKTGNQIKFGIEISGIDDVKLQNGIKELLQQKFAYENMGFNSVINTGSILSEIYAKYGVVPTVNMTIMEEFTQDKPLSFKPIKNTLKLYGVNDNIVAWEENDLLYGMTAKNDQIPFFLFKVVASMGTMFLLMQDGEKNNVDTETYNYYDVNSTEEEEPEENEVENNGGSGSGSGNESEEEEEEEDDDEYRKYNAYDTDIKYSMTSYNRFYLYDVSTNTIKPFDGCMQNLIYTDTNPSLKYSAWSTDEQTFGNLYDIKFLSTNNALAVEMVFKSSGAEVEKVITEKEEQNTEYETSYKLKYWSENNMTLYEKYLEGEYIGYESNEDYKGKYRTIFFIKNPLALKNANSDSWKAFQDSSHGNPEKMTGLYTGLCNYNESEQKFLDIKSNWFIYNNKQYYAYYIDNKYVYITNGAKNLAVSLNGSFLGMMPYENDLYVVNESYITKIVNFEGLKEKEEIYQIYKDYNTPMTIREIIREFDNQIVIRTIDNEFYTATGFEVLAGNKIGFKDIKQVFTDVNIDEDVKIGGCTKDYITAYRVINDNLETVEKESGFVFYCYDMNINKTSVYNKTSNFSNEESVDTTEETFEEVHNLATMYPYPLYWGGLGGGFVYEKFSNYKKDYINGSSSTTGYSELLNKEDIYLLIADNTRYRKSGKNRYAALQVLCVDKVKDKNGNPTSNFVFVQNYDENGILEGINTTPIFGESKSHKTDGDTNEDMMYDHSGKKSNHGGSVNISDSHVATSINKFFRICSEKLYEKYKPKDNETERFESELPAVVISQQDGKITYKSEKIYLIKRTVPNYNSTQQETEVPTWDSFYFCKMPRLGVGNIPNSFRVEDKMSGEYYTTNGTDWFIQYPTYEAKYSDIGNYAWNVDYGNEEWETQKIQDPRTSETREIDNLKKAEFTLFKKRVITYRTVSLDYTNEDDTKELVTIGYFDTVKNSCVNDRGSQIAYVRYQTQNPNLSEDSYLVLDKNEIKFI